MIYKFQDNNQRLDIFQNNEQVGAIRFYKNQFHQQNTYLQLDIAQLGPEEFAAAIKLCLAKLKSPLQVMLSSSDSVSIHKLQYAGFNLVRRCLLAEKRKEDLLYPLSKANSLATCSIEQAQALPFAQLLYDYYQKNHASINPWTAGFEVFCQNLPKTIFYNKDLPKNFAFIEEDEIAYCHGTDALAFQHFALDVSSHLFSLHEQIYFEADDNDKYAQVLLSLFRKKAADTFDTYVLPYQQKENS